MHFGFSISFLISSSQRTSKTPSIIAASAFSRKWSATSVKWHDSAPAFNLSKVSCWVCEIYGVIPTCNRHFLVHSMFFCQLYRIYAVELQMTR